MKLFSINRSKRFPHLAAFLLVFGCSFNVWSDIGTNLKSFDHVWSTVKEVHWDPEKVGPLWDEAKEKYRPQVEKAKSVGETRAILNAMLSELGLSHYGVSPGLSENDANVGDGASSENGNGNSSESGNENKGGSGTSGLDFRATDDGVIVSKVRDGSYAEKAGVKVGWIVERVGNQSVQELVDALSKATHGPIRYETRIGLQIMPALASGVVGSKRAFIFRDSAQNTHKMELMFEPMPGIESTFGKITQKVHTVKKSLDGNIGYYYLSDFLDPFRVMGEYREFIRDKKHSKGLIIDLRGNPGGIGGMAMGMTSEFSDKDTSLGAMISKSNTLKFFVTKNYNPVTSPVAILIDECSASTSEIFSGGMQDLGLARIFGRRSAGLSLPSVIVSLPNGDTFQYAVSNYVSASGQELEGRGVIPDEIVALSPELLQKDPDPTLTKALNWIKQQNQ